ncbi:MAG: sensor histidine kinase [Hyphomicrobiales bacterium]
MKGRKSLSFRLVAISVIGSAVILAITGILLVQLFRTSIERNYDARLQTHLDGLLANIELSRNDELQLVRPLPEPQFDLPFSGWYWQVLPRSNSKVQPAASDSLLDQLLDPAEGTSRVTKSDGEEAYYLRGPEQEILRVFEERLRLANSSEQFTFMVAGDMKEVEWQVSSFIRTLLITLGTLALGLALATFFLVRFGLRPLRTLRDELIVVRAGKTKRLDGGYPVEIQPVADELNLLLENNDEVVERARTQVGNLAHALKTPLSVINNEARTLDSELSSKVLEQSRLMQEQVNLYLDRASRAARARTLASATEVEPVLKSLARTLERINAESGIKVEVKCTPNARFRGEKQDLEEMVGNLLENAFKFAEKKILLQAFERASEIDEGRVWIDLFVRDDGPGLTPQQRHEAIKRGARIDESKPGSGLGLNIVSETAAMYGGKIKLERSKQLGGLEVKVKLPAVAD